METRAIDVHIWSAEYDCCGTPFAVGDEIGFALRAMLDGDTGDAGDRDRPAYFDERHPMDDDDPPLDVRGRVEAITAVHQRMVRVAGAHYLTNDPDDTLERAVDAVPADGAPMGYGGADYRVLFAVAAETRLPAPRARERRTDQAPDDELRGPLNLLTAVVEDVLARFGERVEVLRARGDASVTLAPRAEDAATVRWNAYENGLHVELERAEWVLPWSPEGVAGLRELVEAAESGGFTERVDDGRFVSTATAPSGAVRTAAADAPSFPSGGSGLVWMTETAAVRLHRANSGRGYPAWG
ncbi:DUF6578 domain-containing protein [Leifsonia sp. NPDC058194]|uniref:DUF6578 domain-containing protein n=1 Tax=Leifsonia sp. NPDC058194 TaxID=3346374 RepID=UPI0036D8F2AA